MIAANLEPFRGYDPFCSPFLIRESPLVNEKGDEYLFVATSPESGKTLKCGINLWDMLSNIGAEQFHYDEFELFFERETYEMGLIAMLHDVVTSDEVFTVPGKW